MNEDIGCVYFIGLIFISVSTGFIVSSIAFACLIMGIGIVIGALLDYLNQ
jgi:hypothetical protein